MLYFVGHFQRIFVSKYFWQQQLLLGAWVEVIKRRPYFDAVLSDIIIGIKHGFSCINIRQDLDEC